MVLLWTATCPRRWGCIHNSHKVQGACCVPGKSFQHISFQNNTLWNNSSSILKPKKSSQGFVDKTSKQDNAGAHHFHSKIPVVPKRGDTAIRAAADTSQYWIMLLTTQLDQSAPTESPPHLTGETELSKFDFTDSKVTLNNLAVEGNSSSVETRNQNQLSLQLLVLVIRYYWSSKVFLNLFWSVSLQIVLFSTKHLNYVVHLLRKSI